MWTIRRIFKELVDSDRRRQILASFWKHAEPTTKLLASAQLAKVLHFRDETMKKMPVGKKSELLVSRIGSPEFDQFFEAALLQYHTHNASEMMAAFLDRWGVPHNNGAIEAEDYTAPTADQVRAAVAELESKYDRRDIALYFATAGLLMGDEWSNAMWPVVDELHITSAAS